VGKYNAFPLIVPTLRVGMQPVTLRVTTVFDVAQVLKLERGASLEAFPRRAGERSRYNAFPLIVPTLRVGMQPVTLRVTTVFDVAQVLKLERGAFL